MRLCLCRSRIGILKKYLKEWYQAYLRSALRGLASRIMKRLDMRTAKGHTTSLIPISYFSCGLFYSYGFTSFPQYPHFPASLHVRPGLSYKSQQSIRSVSARKTSIGERSRINPPWWKKSLPWWKNSDKSANSALVSSALVSFALVKSAMVRESPLRDDPPWRDPTCNHL